METGSALEINGVALSYMRERDRTREREGMILAWLFGFSCGIWACIASYFAGVRYADWRENHRKEKA